MSPRARRELNARLLNSYVENIRLYRTTWAVPIDREVHLNAWAKARADHEPRRMK